MGGAWQSSAGTGSFQIAGLADDTPVQIALRAVNTSGFGATGTPKSATPTNGSSSGAYTHAELPSPALWLHARGMTVGGVSNASLVTDAFGVASIASQNLDGGAFIAEVLQDIGNTNTFLVRGHASNATAGGRQRIDANHGALGDAFTMAILVKRDGPSVGQYIGIGASDGVGGVRSAFYYANKTGVGGYGTGAQWDLASTSSIAANNTAEHLMVIVSDNAQATQKTRLWIDGVEDTTISNPSAVPSWRDVTRIGSGASGVTNNYNIYFTDFIVLGTALTDVALRQKMEGRMAWDAGRTDLLPVNHPYKTTQP